jgi:hypothetical protein
MPSHILRSPYVAGEEQIVHAGGHQHGGHQPQRVEQSVHVPCGFTPPARFQPVAQAMRLEDHTNQPLLRTHNHNAGQMTGNSKQ